MSKILEKIQDYAMTFVVVLLPVVCVSMVYFIYTQANHSLITLEKKDWECTDADRAKNCLQWSRFR
jgi:hypothetical protein